MCLLPALRSSHPAAITLHRFPLLTLPPFRSQAAGWLCAAVCPPPPPSPLPPHRNAAAATANDYLLFATLESHTMTIHSTKISEAARAPRSPLHPHCYSALSALILLPSRVGCSSPHCPCPPHQTNANIFPCQKKQNSFRRRMSVAFRSVRFVRLLPVAHARALLRSMTNSLLRY